MNSFFFVSFLICLIIHYSPVRAKLLYVVELNRHGARTSTNYKEGPLSSFFGENMKLTPNGFRQHQLLGQFIRDKYITNLHFLSETFNSNQFEIISTQTQRTIFSAEGFISGIYPGTVGKIIYDSPNVNVISNDTIPILFNKPAIVKEIDIKVIDLKKDVLFHPLSCKLQGKLLKTSFKETAPKLFSITDQEIQNSINEIASFLNITLNHNANIPDKNKISEIQKLFFVNSYHHDRDWNKLTYGSLALMRKLVLNKWYSERLKDSKYHKLSVSALFDTILNKFEGAKKKQNFLRYIEKKKFTVYSTHDTTIVSVLSNLISYEKLNELVIRALKDKEVFDYLVPPFASSILFELHLDETSNELYVMIFYNNRALEKDMQVISDSNIIKGRILYNDFKQLLQSRIDDDYKKIDCSEINIERDKYKHNDDVFLIPNKLKD